MNPVAKYRPITPQISASKKVTTGMKYLSKTENIKY